MLRRLNLPVVLEATRLTWVTYCSCKTRHGFNGNPIAFHLIISSYSRKWDEDFPDVLPHSFPFNLIIRLSLLYHRRRKLLLKLIPIHGMDRIPMNIYGPKLFIQDQLIFPPHGLPEFVPAVVERSCKK